MVNRNRGKKQQEETEKHQHVFMTESNLFKGYTTKDFLDYNRKLSSKLNSDGR